METNKPNTPESAAVTKADVDFDRSEPRALLIAAFGLASILGLTATMLGVQAYFDHIYEQEMYQKVMVPVAEDLRNLHIQEDQELNSYKYLDRNNGVVQIPIQRAMQLIAKEAADGKLKYFQKSTPVKVPTAADAAAPMALAPGTPAANGAVPGVAAANPGAPPAANGGGAAPKTNGNSGASSQPGPADKNPAGKKL